MAKKLNKWEIDQAVDTLIRAQEIMADKILFPRVKQAFAKKQRAMKEAALEFTVAAKQRSMRAK